jgi:hypothetical protein
MPRSVRLFFIRLNLLLASRVLSGENLVLLKSSGRRGREGKKEIEREYEGGKEWQKSLVWVAKSEFKKERERAGLPFFSLLSLFSPRVKALSYRASLETPVISTSCPSLLHQKQRRIGLVWCL